MAMQNFSALQRYSKRFFTQGYPVDDLMVFSYSDDDIIGALAYLITSSSESIDGRLAGLSSVQRGKIESALQRTRAWRIGLSYEMEADYEHGILVVDSLDTAFLGWHGLIVTRHPLVAARELAHLGAR